MARVFDRRVSTAPPTGDSPVATGRSVVRPLGAAVACLLVSFLVVTRTQAAAQGPAGFAHTDVAAAGVARTDGAAAGIGRTDLAAGHVDIGTDDAGRSLFRVPDMAPGRPVANCIAITYSGTIVPAIVRLSAKAGGSLAPSLSVAVEEGISGRYNDCSGFRPTRTLFSGTLAAMAKRPPIEAFRPSSHDETHSFRFTFTLDSAAVQGAVAATEFAWTTSLK